MDANGEHHDQERADENASLPSETSQDAGARTPAESAVAAQAPAQTNAATAPPPAAVDLIPTPQPGRPPIKLNNLQIAAIVLLAAFTIFSTWRTKKLEKSLLERTPASAMISKPAPDFSLQSLSGDTISLAGFRGKKAVVVAYWASWCGPCKIELPELKQFYEHFHKNNANFEILAISIDEEKSAAEKYAAAEQLPFPVLFDPQSKTASAYTVEAIPTTFVIDKTGKIIYAHTGMEQGMQFQLMSQLGIKFSGTEDSADNDLVTHGEKDGDKK